MNTLALGHDAGRKSNGQYASTSGVVTHGSSPSLLVVSANLSLGDRLGEALRRTVLDLSREPGFPGSADRSGPIRGEELTDFFPDGNLDLLRGLWLCLSRGSDLDLSKGVAAGNFVSLLLIPGWNVGALGIVGILSCRSSFHVETGCPPMPWTKMMLLNLGQRLALWQVESPHCYVLSHRVDGPVWLIQERETG